MSGIKGSFKYYIIVLIILLILSACERPLQSDEKTDSEVAATEVVVSAVTEPEVVIESDDPADEAEVDQADSEVEEAEPTAEPFAEEVETETEADTESPRPAEEVGKSDAETSEVEESVSTDPDVGGGTPNTAEEASETEVGEAEADVESTDEPETTTEDSTSDAPAADTEAAGETTEAEESVASEENTEAQEIQESTPTPVESSLPTTHTVQPSENLYRIGLQYGVSWVALARYNNIYNPNYIYAGQVLQIPGGSTPPPVPDPVPPVKNPPNYVNYTVKPGDTLGKISQAFGVRPDVIAEVNGIVNPNLIYVGQVLKIPTSSPEAPPATTHVVQPGETLYKISLQYGVYWLSIAQANNIWPPYVIYAGQTLVIPGA